jgi:hypothetical protein
MRCVLKDRQAFYVSDLLASRFLSFLWQPVPLAMFHHLHYADTPESKGVHHPSPSKFSIPEQGHSILDT